MIMKCVALRIVEEKAVIYFNLLIYNIPIIGYSIPLPIVFKLVNSSLPNENEISVFFSCNKWHHWK